MTEQSFWKTSALGRSIKVWAKDANVSTRFYFENTRGLATLFNECIDSASPDEILVFVHDDVWLDDHMLLEKLRLALRRYDVVGVAGNRRRVPSQPAWLFSRRDPAEGFVWDHPHLSGQVAHGRPGQSSVSVFGPTPVACELLDGVFLAVRADVVRASRVRFDERFTFDFYDMDFCRSARKAGLSLGTWPIGIIHESAGAFGSPGWEQGWKKYLEKWKR